MGYYFIAILGTCLLGIPTGQFRTKKNRKGPGGLENEARSVFDETGQ